MDHPISYKQYYLPTVEIKYYIVMTAGRNFFDHPVKNDFTTYYSIKKIATCQGDDHTTGISHFTKYCKLIAIDLRKQKLDVETNKTN